MNVVIIYRSYKVGVKTLGDTDWVYNSLRFPSKEDAVRYAEDLVSRWYAVIDYTITQSPDMPNQPPFEGGSDAKR